MAVPHSSESPCAAWGSPADSSAPAPTPGSTAWRPCRCASRRRCRRSSWAGSSRRGRLPWAPGRWRRNAGGSGTRTFFSTPCSRSILCVVDGHARVVDRSGARRRTDRSAASSGSCRAPCAVAPPAGVELVDGDDLARLRLLDQVVVVKAPVGGGVGAESLARGSSGWRRGAASHRGCALRARRPARRPARAPGRCRCARPVLRRRRARTATHPWGPRRGDRRSSVAGSSDRRSRHRDRL